LCHADQRLLQAVWECWLCLISPLPVQFSLQSLWQLLQQVHGNVSHPHAHGHIGQIWRQMGASGAGWGHHHVPPGITRAWQVHHADRVQSQLRQGPHRGRHCRRCHVFRNRFAATNWKACHKGFCIEVKVYLGWPKEESRHPHSGLSLGFLNSRCCDSVHIDRGYEGGDEYAVDAAAQMPTISYKHVDCVQVSRLTPTSSQWQQELPAIVGVKITLPSWRLLTSFLRR